MSHPISLPCAKCGASPGQSCQGKSGDRKAFHRERGGRRLRSPIAEVERAHKAAVAKRHNELCLARLTAAKLLAGSAPIAPRDEVVAEVRRKREASKFSPASGGVVNGGMGSMDAYRPEGTRGAAPTLLDCMPATVPVKSPSTGALLQ
jgi:hypothetical protein